MKWVDVSDWDQLVTETYKRPYQFQQQEGCQDRGVVNLVVSKNPKEPPYDYERDSIPESSNTNKMGVSFKAWLERDPQKPLSEQEYDFELEFWWTRNFYPSIDMIAADLLKRDLLEEGEYKIVIDW